MVEPWGVLLQEDGRALLYEIAGGDVTLGDVATAKIDDQRLIRLDAKEVPPPAPILPRGAARLGALRQITPAAILPPSARIVIAGALKGRPDWEGIICLPGRDVTQWVHVSAREIVSFQGAATGRLAAAFAAGGGVDAAALGDTIARPERLAAHLNAASVMGDAAAILGHLLGAELAAMRAYWLGQDVIIIGTQAPYGEALLLQGVDARVVPYAQAWQDGLMALGAAAGFTG